LKRDMLSPLLLSLVLGAPNVAAETPEATAPVTTSARHERGMDALGVPLVSYNSDLGMGFGAVGGAYFYAPGYKPYRHGIALQTFFTTRGFQNHWLRYDGPNFLGIGRLELRAEYKRERLSPYYGVGNLAGPVRSADPDDERNNFERTSPMGWARMRLQPFGESHPFEPFFGYAYRHTSLELYPGSVLAREAPMGLGGGATGQALAGVLWDTRDDEADPTRGGVEEIALRLAGAATGSRYAYSGVFFGERRFWTLWRNRLVLAQRLAVDTLWGNVPFFEWSSIGGITGAEGIGGMSSVRGVPRNRFVGTTKAFTNTELRFTALTFRLFDAPVKVGGLGFVDFGRVWQPGVADGPWYRWHPGVGGGLRVVRRSAVLRFDYAYAPEQRRQGLYVAFGQMF
jgi:hypothetical protein